MTRAIHATPTGQGFAAQRFEPVGVFFRSLLSVDFKAFERHVVRERVAPSGRTPDIDSARRHSPSTCSLTLNSLRHDSFVRLLSSYFPSGMVPLLLVPFVQLLGLDDGIHGL